MKKYQIIFTFLFIVFYILWLYMINESFRKSKEVKLTDINFSIINIKKIISIDTSKIYHSNYKLWGLEVSKILENRIKKEQEIEIHKKNLNSFNRKKTAEVNLNDRKICLEKKCWIFVGILGIGKKIKVTLISTEEKSKLKTFQIGDELLENLVIKSITIDKMVLIHKVNKKIFVLKLFDINSSEYYPKKIKEVNE